MFNKVIAEAGEAVISAGEAIAADASAVNSYNSPVPMGGELITTILMMIFYVVVAAGFIGMVVFGVKMLSKKTDDEALNKARKGFKTSLLVFIIPLLVVIVGIFIMSKIKG
jgi:Na+/proline symporter